MRIRSLGTGPVSAHSPRVLVQADGSAMVPSEKLYVLPASSQYTCPRRQTDMYRHPSLSVPVNRSPDTGDGPGQRGFPGSRWTDHAERPARGHFETQECRSSSGG